MKKTQEEEFPKVIASNRLRQEKDLLQTAEKLPYITPMAKVDCIELEKCFAVSLDVQTSDLKYNEYQDETISSDEDIELY